MSLRSSPRRNLPQRLRTLLIALSALVLPAAGVLTATPAEASAPIYYVSTTGSDSNSGTSPTTPLRTIQRCADLAGPGTTCSIMGGTYHETVSPAHSGTSGHPITFTPYAGQSVTVDGADPVTGWAQVSDADLTALTGDDPRLARSDFADAVAAGHMYRASVSVTAGLKGNQVFVGGTAANQAQWPDPGPDPLTPVIEYAGTGTTSTTIADPALDQAAGYWTGASAYTGMWYNVQTTAVTSSAPGSVTLAKGPNLGLAGGNQARYYLFGTLETFSHPGQWFYDRTAQALYLWTADGRAPAAGSVELKQRTYAFDLTGASYIDIDALHLKGASLSTGDTSTADVLTHLDVEYPSAFDTAPTYIEGETDTGVILRGTGNALRESTVAHSAGNGVLLLGSGNIVSEDVIHDVDAMGTYAAAVNVVGSDQTVTRSTLYRVGRAGISVDWHIQPSSDITGDVFSYNDISAYARLNVDSGAIYACCNQDFTGSSIDHNRVHDATPMPLVKPYAMAGVYLDGDSGGGQVVDNVGWNQSNGTVFMNSHGLGTKVYDNDGGVTLYPGAYDSGTAVVNNIGADLTDTTAGGVTIATNLPRATDPQYADPAAGDYRLQAGSPARGAGTEIAGVTTGHVDAKPSIGAYQYGAPAWSAGADGASSGVLFASVGDGAFTVPVGGSVATPLTATMTDGTTTALDPSGATYTSADPDVATVDADGTVHGVASGTTVVTVQALYDGSQVANASFSVTVPPTGSALPSGWSVTQLGTDLDGAPTGGFATDDASGGGTIATTGYNIWSATDSGTFLHTDLSGTGDVTATVTIDAQSAPPCGVGLMIRDGAAADAKEVSLRSQDSGLRLVWRSGATLPGTAYLTTAKPSVSVPVQLKLVKSGDTFTASYNTGSGWTPMGTTTDTMGTDLQVGLGIYSGAYAGTRASFSGLTVQQDAS